MHKTANEIVIQGDPERIYQLAAAVEEWPAFLPHYRWVRVRDQEGNRRTVEMAAWRTGVPVQWVSHQWLWPEERRITFRHIGGLSRGMMVEWRIGAAEEGARGGGGDGATTRVPDLAPSGRLAPSPPRPLAPSPRVRVSITHELRLELPVIRSPIGQWVVGEIFVKAVAGRTLTCLKQRVEGKP